MNVLTQGDTSIVSDVPGTTADPKIATGEIHALGACKFFDTPGIDEASKLGDQKRAKAHDVLKRADASLIVVSLRDAAHSLAAARDMIERAGTLCHNPKALLVINAHGSEAANTRAGDLNRAVEAVERELGLVDDDGVRHGDAPPSLVVDLHSADANARVSAFLAANVHGYRASTELLPPLDLGPRSTVLLNAPMDKETPHGRLLRPQAWTQEALLRRFASSFVYRMDLGRGRSPDPDARRDEEARFRDALARLKGPSGDALDLMITDSQAMDLVHPWTLDEEGRPLVALTTFSVLMVNYMSGGRLPEFVDGLRVVRDMVATGRGGRVLICEACNHDRIIDDIGTDQVRSRPAVVAAHRSPAAALPFPRSPPTCAASWETRCTSSGPSAASMRPRTSATLTSSFTAAAACWISRPCAPVSPIWPPQACPSPTTDSSSPGSRPRRLWSASSRRGASTRGFRQPAATTATQGGRLSGACDPFSFPSRPCAKALGRRVRSFFALRGKGGVEAGVGAYLTMVRPGPGAAGND